MKKYVSIGLFGFSALFAVAQTEWDVPTNQIIVGRNFKTNTDVKAKETIFSDRISSWHLDDSTKLLTVQLRGQNPRTNVENESGELEQFDLSTKQIRWHNKVNFNTTNINWYNDILIKTAENRSVCVDNETGENLWRSKNAICYVNSARKVGAGYRSTSPDLLEGIDLNTGKSIWKRTIKRDFGVNDMVPLNDSVMLVAANGLHAVSLKDGSGWDYDARTGKKDHSAAIAANIVSFAFSILTKSNFEITTGHDLYSDVVSNVLIDSTGIYMADKDAIVRLDVNGELFWKTALPRNMVSKSSVFVRNNRIYMINYGYAFMNGELVNYGKPFIAAFNMQDGNQIFLNTIDYRKVELIGYRIQGDTLCMLSKNRISSFSLLNGSELMKQTIKEDALGSITQFAGNDLYIQSDSIFKCLPETKPTYVYALTNKGSVLVLNNKLELDNVILTSQLYFCYLETNGYKFLENGNHSIVIDKNGLLIAELDISGNAILRGTKLYEVQGNSLVELDISQFIEK